MLPTYLSFIIVVAYPCLSERDMFTLTGLQLSPFAQTGPLSHNICSLNQNTKRVVVVVNGYCFDFPFSMNGLYCVGSIVVLM